MKLEFKSVTVLYKGWPWIILLKAKLQEFILFLIVIVDEYYI
jgi:hypothetical protein